jgi:hypothetical protein
MSITASTRTPLRSAKERSVKTPANTVSNSVRRTISASRRSRSVWVTL